MNEYAEAADVLKAAEAHLPELRHGLPIRA
jgi:hypothetical protein